MNLSYKTKMHELNKRGLKYAVVPGSGGQTVGEMLEPQLQEAYTTGKMPPLLPSGQ